jgi:hypothetical protein
MPLAGLDQHVSRESPHLGAAHRRIQAPTSVRLSSSRTSVRPLLASSAVISKPDDQPQVFIVLRCDHYKEFHQRMTAHPQMRHPIFPQGQSRLRGRSILSPAKYHHSQSPNKPKAPQKMSPLPSSSDMQVLLHPSRRDMILESTVSVEVDLTLCSR